MNTARTITFGWITKVFLFSITLAACQRELHFDETSAQGTLNKDASGNCKPVITSGVYNIDTTITDANFIEVEISVTKKGSYSIYTDTVNGYWFQAKGKFDQEGTARVRLLAGGRPQLAGFNLFTIKFNNSSCQAGISVLDAGPAQYNVAGAPNGCANFVVEGEYIQSAKLDSSNRVKVNLDVTRPGYYTISLTSVNGYSFSGAGILSTLGLQAISLYGEGTPLNSGTDFFTLAGASGACAFAVTVKSATNSNLNHFPLTLSSTWTYNDLQFPGDSIKRIIIDSAIVNGKWYRNIQQKDRIATTTLQARRSGNDYFEYGSADKYTTALIFSPVIKADILFLKEGLATSDTWTSVNYTGTTLAGQAYSLRYTYLCTHDDAVVVINGQTFEHIYKIEVRPQTAPPSSPFSNTGEMFEYYYADGIGLIYLRKTFNGVSTMEANIRRYKVF